MSDGTSGLVPEKICVIEVIIVQFSREVDRTTMTRSLLDSMLRVPDHYGTCLCAWFSL